MPRLRWLIVGVLLLSALAVAVLGSRGPFGAHPVLAYNQFLTDFQAGRVSQMTQWRDQLEVADDGQLRSVAVPPGRDLPGDLAAARYAGRVGVNYASLPDDWLMVTTPLLPTVLGVAGLVVGVTGMRRACRTATMGREPS